jgi:hypothetical protein
MKQDMYKKLILRCGLVYSRDHPSGSQMFIWCMFTFLSHIYAYLCIQNFDIVGLDVQS